MDAEVIELSSSSDLSDIDDNAVEEVIPSGNRPAALLFVTLPPRRRLARHPHHLLTASQTPPSNGAVAPSATSASDAEAVDSDYDAAEQSTENEDDDLEIIEFKRKTQSLISHKHEQRAEKLNQVTCPICFDPPDFPTVTSCGHLFCLECIKQSISSSAARGQVSGSSRGSGLCPLCRKRVVFKDTVVLRLSIKGVSEIPPLES